jgi:hypothetical protein
MSVFAFLKPGLPHSNNFYLNGTQSYGFDEFVFTQLVNIVNYYGHYFLTINILGAELSSFGNLS